MWLRRDPNAKITYQGTDGEKGAVMAWASDNQDVGRGEQEIIALKDGERMEVEIRFSEPFESTDSAYTTATALMGLSGALITLGMAAVLL